MERDLFRSFETFVKAHELIRKDETVVTGVSGGADSMCLLLLLHALQKSIPFSLIAVHINHMIRGASADADEAFVKAFCKERGIPCIAEQINVPAICKETKESPEEAGRRIRYETFCRIAKENSACIAVAHHRDDNAETVLLNLIRGSGIKGLCGMQAESERGGCRVIRPLLTESRKNLEAYLAEQKISWRHDESNDEAAYARNAVRLQVMPALSAVNERAAQHICESAQILSEAEAFLSRETEKRMREIVSCREGKTVLSLQGLRETDPAIAKRILLETIAQAAGKRKDITSSHVSQVLELASLQSGRRISLPYGLEARRVYEEIRIGKAEPEDEGFSAEPLTVRKEELGPDEKEFALPDGGTICFRTVPVDASNRAELTEKNQYTKAFDYDTIENDIIVGAKASGDEIFLREGRKTVKKYFIDEKVPADQRAKILLVKDGQQVLWITGCRISEKHKITEATKKGLLITFKGGDHGYQH